MSYHIPDVLDAAFPAKPMNEAVFTTGRSGLPVTISHVRLRNSEQSPFKANVLVTLDGEVDYADAEQIAEFFTALSIRLKVTQ